MTLSLAFVTGATGAVGPTLVRRLLADGYRVRALVRAGREAALPHGVEATVGTLDDDDALRRGVEGTDAIFHLAAKLHLNNPDPTLRAEYERINVGGTERLAQAARAAGVERFLFFSTISVYGPGEPGTILDESSPLRPETIYGETKARAEETVRAILPSATILRLAAVYGPQMRGNYPRLAAAIRRGLFLPIGDGSNRRTLVHVQDVAAGALLAAQHPAAVGETFNLTDGQLHTMREIIHVLAEAGGKRDPRLHLPVAPLRLAARLAELPFRLIGKRAPVGRATIEKLLEDVAVSGAKMQQRLGFQPQLSSFAEGWRET